MAISLLPHQGVLYHSMDTLRSMAFLRAALITGASGGPSKDGKFVLMDTACTVRKGPS